MAWTTTQNDWFRKGVLDALATPATTGLDLDGGHTIKIALYDNSLGTTNYNTDVGYGATPYNTGELAPAGNYTTGGAAVVTPAIASAGASPGETITFSFASPYTVAWPTATFSTYGGVMYDDTSTNNYGIVSMFFGSVMSPSSGTFTISYSGVSGAILTFA